MSRPRARKIFWASLAILAAAAVVIPCLARRSISFYTDGAGLRSPAETAQRALREVLWEAAAPVREAGGAPGINLPDGDSYEPRVSPAGDLLVFTRGRPGEGSDLWVSTRARDGWGAPRPLEEINTGWDELSASFSPDGSALWFASDRPEGEGGFDLWVSFRGEDGALGEPLNLGPRVNGPGDELGPALAPDQKTLYFSSDRRSGGDSAERWRGTLRGSTRAARHDIFLVPVEGDLAAAGPLSEDAASAATLASAFGEARPLEALDGPLSSEGAAAISPRGDFLYFSSDRPGGAGGFDLYRARLTGGLPGPVESLGPGINSPLDELDPALAAGGFELYFARSQDGRERILQSVSREVYLAREDRGPYLSLSALLDSVLRGASRIPPVILWLLLALIGALLLHLLLRKRIRTLTLLTRCFLLALVVHLFLALWMHRTEVERLVLMAIEKEGSTGVSFEGLGDSEEKVGLAIREAVAETGDDGAGGVELGMEAARLREPSAAPAGPSSAPIALAPATAELRGELGSVAREIPSPLVLGEAPPAALADGGLPLRAGEPSPPDLAERHAPAAAPAPAPAPEPLSPLAPGPPRAARIADLPVNSTASIDARPDPSPLAAGAASFGAAGGAAAGGAPSLEPRPLALEPAAIGSSLPAAEGDAPPPELARREGPGPAPVKDPPEALPLSLPDRPAGARSTGPARGGAIASGMTSGIAAPRAEPLAAPLDGPVAKGADPSLALPRPLPLPPPGPLLSGRSEGGEKKIAGTGGDSSAEIPGAGLPPSLFSSSPSPASPPALAARSVPSPQSVPSDSPPRAGLDLGPSPRRALGELRDPSPLSAGSPVAAAGEGPPAAAAAGAGGRAKGDGREGKGRRGELEGSIGQLRLPGEGGGLPFSPAPSRGEGASSYQPKLYELRGSGRREEALRAGGGGDLTERAVERGLAWLALHQSPDGHWSLHDFASHLPRVSRRDLAHPGDQGEGLHDSRGGGGTARNGDTAATGLALLAFLGHGDTRLKAGPYQKAVALGLEWLLGKEEENGDLRGGGNLYMHGIASFALCEAFAYTRDPELKEAAEKALEFTVRSQNPRLGGWRYEPYPQSNDSDTSVFGWMLMAIKSARQGGLEVDDRCLVRAAAYLDRARASRKGGRYSYQPGNARSSRAINAQGFFCEQVLADTLLGKGNRGLWDRSPEQLRRSADESVAYLLESLPGAAEDEKTDFYYWYYGTLALFQEGGEAWRSWNGALLQALPRLQLGDEHGTAAGSWDPLDRRAATGGRVYSTALSILCLEVYYRYGRLKEK